MERTRTRRGGDDDDTPRRGGSGFRYRERDQDAARRRMEQGGGSNFDSFIPDTVAMFKAAVGDNTIRILPPTWDDAEHFGLEVFVHYDVGPDKVAYLCLDKMKGKPCPICEERARATREGDTEYADQLRPSARVLYYVLDRAKPREGVKVWSVGKRMDSDILKVSMDRETKELLAIDHPDKGYDLSFMRDGEGLKTRYSGFLFARRPSGIGNDEALDFIGDHPLPDLLKFFSYEHIKKTFAGGAGAAARDDEPPAHRGRSRSARDEDDDPPAKRSRSKAPPEVDMTWEEVHDLSFRKLSNLIDEHDLDIDPEDSKTDEELADRICEELGIEEPKRTRRSARDEDDDPPRRPASDDDDPPRRRKLRAAQNED